MKNKKFNEGESLRVVRVRFPGQVNPGTFLLGSTPYTYGQKVVALSERGPAVGYINSLPFQMVYQSEMGELREIERAATDADDEKFKDEYQKQREAQEVFKRLVAQHELPMEFLEMEIGSCGEKFTFSYFAPERVDFRELLRDLAKELKKKIELRQVHRANGCQGTGPCGVELCTFINSVMNDGKKGCNEFHCRLDHKDPFYEDKKSRLPKVGEYVSVKTGELGRVEKVELWKEEFVILTDQGVRKRFVSELYLKTLKKKDVNFPKVFEHIVDESRTVLGKDEYEKKKLREMEREKKLCQDRARAFVEANFKQLFDTEKNSL